MAGGKDFSKKNLEFGSDHVSFQVPIRYSSRQLDV